MNSEAMIVCYRLVTVPHYAEHWSEATCSPYWEGVRGMGRQGALPGARKSRKASDYQRLFCFSVLPQGLEPWTPTLRVSCSTN